jgi:hypothetical protein
MARLLKLAYQLQLHRLGSWSLHRWGVTLALGAAAFLILQWLVRGRPPVPWWHWLLPAALIAATIGLILLQRWATARHYVRFTPEPAAAAPAPLALDPRDKVQVRATGRFQVEGRSGEFANLLSYWRTFASREHAIMAISHGSRFLLIGFTPEDQVGMWYIFFMPQAVRTVTAGRLTFGADEGPALCVRYVRSEANADSKKPPRQVDETVYLTFEDDATRRRVWGDLLL